MGVLENLRTWNDRNELDRTERVAAEVAHRAGLPLTSIEQRALGVVDDGATSVGDRLRRATASSPIAGRPEPLFIEVRPKADRYVYVLLRDLTLLDAEAGRIGHEWYEAHRNTLTVDKGSAWINRLKAKIAEVSRNPGRANVVQTTEPAPNPKASVWAEWRAVAGELASLGGRHGARFAVDTEDDAVNRIAFWWIVPNEGPHGTRYFIRQVIGGQGPVRVRMSPEAMLAIGRKIQAAGAEDAMRRYGREIGECGHCGRTLTNDASRAAGIGPVCAAKHG